MSDSPPTNLGPYRVEGQIGSGGMGAVFRAYDQRLDRHVAIKRILVLPEERRPSQRQRFLREARLAARLSHPAIVQVHDLLSAEGDDWIVMEWLDGATLASMLRRGPLSLGPVLTLGRQLCDGLAHAHRRGTIHRDLKPANVMVTEEGQAKILDFGLAKESSGLRSDQDQSTQTATGAILGTYHAMSPEQARGFDIDARSDLFSLGSLIYEALSGTRPFEAETPLDTLTRVCVYEPPPLDTLGAEIPSELSQLVEALLQKVPERRPQRAEAVLERLEAIQAAEEAVDGGLKPGETLETVAAPTWENTPTLTSSQVERVDSMSSSPALPTSSGSRTRVLLGSLAVLLAGGLALVAFWPGDPWRDDQASARAVEPVASATVAELLDDAQRLLPTYYREEDLEGAIRAFKEVLKRQPNSAAAHAGLARAYWRRSYLQNRDPLWVDLALKHAHSAVELEPFLTEAKVSLALLLTLSRKLDEAEEVLQGAETLDPSNPDIPWAWGELSKTRGQFDEAERQAQKALHMQEDRADFHDLLGVVLVRQNRLQEALGAFSRSLELAPENIATMRNLAGVYYHLGERGLAAQWMQKALALRPDASLYASLGILYFDEGDYRSAAEVFERALEFPGGVSDPRVWGNLADAYRQVSGRASEAIEAYRRAIDLLESTGSDDVDTVSRLALYRSKAGDVEGARRALESLPSEAADQVQVAYRITVAWEVLGDRAKAWEFLGRTLELGYAPSDLQRDPELSEMTTDLAFDRLLAKLES